MSIFGLADSNEMSLKFAYCRSDDFALVLPVAPTLVAKKYNYIMATPFSSRVLSKEFDPQNSEIKKT